MRFRPGQQSTRFPQAPTGLVYPGDQGVPRGTYATDKNNFAPRLGVVWDPTGTAAPACASRGASSTTRWPGRATSSRTACSRRPSHPSLEVNSPPAAMTLRNPLSATSGGPAGFPPGLTFIGWGADFSTPYAHHFNATWQQQFGDRFAAEIGYVGSRGRNLPIFIEVNPGVLHSRTNGCRSADLSGFRAGADRRSRSPSRGTTRSRRACACVPRTA